MQFADNKKYNVGDVIMISSNLNTEDTYNGWLVSSDMIRMAQDNPIRRIVKKSNGFGNNVYQLEGQEEYDKFVRWTSAMFVGLADEYRIKISKEDLMEFLESN